MHGERVDGNDVLAVREAARRLLERGPRRAPAGAGRDGHLSLPRPLGRRRRQGLPHAARRSPSGASATRSPGSARCCTEHGLLVADDIDEIWKQVAAEVKEAIDEALAAAFPDVDSLYEHVYGDPGWREQFARMRAGAPFGERGEERTWRT